jgi:hypothetical protein
MEALLRHIGRCLDLVVWRGARVDEATSLVLRYCYRGFCFFSLVC